MRLRLLLTVLITLTAIGRAAAEPIYYRLELHVDVDRPAAEAWAKVGGYCDITEWLGLDCEITQGDGGIGTVRLLNGTIVEPMVGQTELSYGYTQPVVEGEYYTLYHGYLEARPVTASTSRLIYTMMWDISQDAEEDVEATVLRRRSAFQAALEKMKAIAETD